MSYQEKMTNESQVYSLSLPRTTRYLRPAQNMVPPPFKARGKDE